MTLNPASARGFRQLTLKCVLRTLVVIAVVAMTVAGGLYVALPGNLAAADGPADPIRCLRRPVMRVLRKLGLAAGDQHHTHTEWGRKDADGRFDRDGGMDLHRETVYRGLFWPVGQRVTCSYFGEEPRAWRALRLCYAMDGQRFVAGERTIENGLHQCGYAEVRGFIPCGATGFWTEETDGSGGVHGLDGSGEVDPFWCD